MKKFLISALLFTSFLGITACANNNQPVEEEEDEGGVPRYTKRKFGEDLASSLDEIKANGEYRLIQKWFAKENGVVSTTPYATVDELVKNDANYVLDEKLNDETYLIDKSNNKTYVRGFSGPWVDSPEQFPDYEICVLYRDWIYNDGIKHNFKDSYTYKEFLDSDNVFDIVLDTDNLVRGHFIMQGDIEKKTCTNAAIYIEYDSYAIDLKLNVVSVNETTIVKQN